MADTLDPWTPQPGGVPQAIPTFPALNQPSSFMDDPRARAALLSFGISMMQPPSFADNPVSQLGRALGSAGETSARIDEADRKDTELGIKQQEASSRQDLRAAQADSALSRAQTAETRAAAAADRSTMAGERLSLQQAEHQRRLQMQTLQSKIRLSNMYSNYVYDTNKANEDGKLTGGKNFKPAPILPMDQWVQQNPMLKNLGLIPSETDSSVPPTPDMATGGPTTPAPAVGARPQSNLNPLPPRDPAQRIKGQVYSNFDGSKNIQWDGKNFIEVP